MLDRWLLILRVLGKLRRMLRVDAERYFSSVNTHLNGLEKRLGKKSLTKDEKELMEALEELEAANSERDAKDEEEAQQTMEKPLRLLELKSTMVNLLMMTT